MYKFFVLSLVKTMFFGVLFFGTNNSINAQSDCSHLSLNYNVNQNFYALGITNNQQEEVEWSLEILNTTYKLDGEQFKNEEGISLAIETTENRDGTLNHLLTPDATIQGNQYIEFVYNGLPPSQDNNYKANTQLNCDIVQNSCSHLSLNYNVNQSFFALGVNNNHQEESNWSLEILDATYKLEPSQFKNADGISLSIESSLNADGTLHHTITPDKPLQPYQFAQFVYNGTPPSTNNNYNATTQINCEIITDPLCANLSFNFVEMQQFGFGFSVQNNNSVPYFPYVVHIANANFKFDRSLLKHDGFDLLENRNTDGTIDYFFIAEEPIGAFSSSPTVGSRQNFEVDPTGDAAIVCESGFISSGLNGGLESHGALASKIALRNFKRALGKETQTVVTRDNSIIAQLAPNQIIAGDERIETSPNDLVGITAAEAIWAGDYFINDNRYASVFGSKTSDVIYDHTKVICDRVKGSELAAVEVVNIDGYETILSVIRRPDGSIEHAISFSLAYDTFGEFTMASHWSVDEYQSSPNFLNYQVWTNSRAKSIAAVQYILDNVVEKNGHTLHPAKVSPTAPQVFARSAYYRLGAFYITLNNKITEPTTVSFSGTYNSKEVDGVEQEFREDLVIVPGQISVKLDIADGNIFEGGITIVTEEDQKDVLYLADGSWGLEYEEHATTVTNYDIITDQREDNENEYLVERGLSVSGTTDNYLSIFKQLKPGGLAVDLSGYNTLSFDSNREGVYRVTLLEEGNNDPNQHLSYTLQTSTNSVDIPYSFFSNAEGAELDPTKITTIYIAFVADDNADGDFDFNIENVRFRNAEESELNIESNENLMLYPNPSNGVVYMTHMFTENSDVTLTVTDPTGAVIQKTNTFATKGLQNFELTLDNRDQGIYLISLHTNQGIFANTLLLTN